MSEMAARVAKAIGGELRRMSPNFSSQMTSHDENKLARAAIEAMRDVPDVCYDEYHCDKMWRDLNSKEVWNLWIDAILADKPGV